MVWRVIMGAMDMAHEADPPLLITAATAAVVGSTAALAQAREEVTAAQATIEAATVAAEPTAAQAAVRLAAAKVAQTQMTEVSAATAYAAD